MISKTQQAGVTVLAILLAFIASGAPSQTKYFAGGTVPFPEDQKALLDQHAEILSLGINADWVKGSRIDPRPYIQAIHQTALAVEQGRIPGAVLLADRYIHNTMPIAIGSKMTDPQHHPLAYDSRYFVEDLTGPLVTVPLVLSAVSAGKLSLGDMVSEHIGELKNSPIGGVSLEQLLRHSSGLPEEMPLGARIETREEFFDRLRAIKPTAKPGRKVQKSSLNFLLLGLVLERVEGVSFSERAARMLEMNFGSGLSSLKLDADKRHLVAPGEYNSWLGRMAWGEPAEPFGLYLAPDAGHTGLTVNADEIKFQCKNLMTAASLPVALPDFPTTEVMSLALSGDPELEGGKKMGLGFEIGRFGPKSFGWDSPHGSSFWVLPDRYAYIVYLSNPWHPKRPAETRADPRDKVLPLLAESLLPVSSPVDIEEINPDPPLSRERAPAENIEP